MKKKTRVEAPLPLSNGGNAAPEEEPHSNGGKALKISKTKMKVGKVSSVAKGARNMVIQVEASRDGGKEMNTKKIKHKMKTDIGRTPELSNGVLEAAMEGNAPVKVSKGVKGNKKKGPKVKAGETPASPSSNGGDSSIGALKGFSNAVKAGAAPEPVGMQIYWNLSSVEANVREAASLALVKELTSAQRDYEERGLGKEERAAEAVILGEGKSEEDGLQECSPAVQYALRRLVRGVASSRESSRQGFALALAAVLGALSSVEGAAVVKLIEKNLEVTAAMKGPEVRDALLGQLFAYGALIRSTRLLGEASTHDQQELAKEVTQQLLLLAKRKQFLREPATYLVAELGEKLGAQGLEKGLCAAPLFSDCLQGSPESISPDTLLLVLKLHKKLPPSILNSCPLIPDSRNLGDMFEQSHLPLLVPCLKETSCCHPRVHSVWNCLLEILFAQKQGLVETPKSNKKGKKKRSLDSESNLEAKIATFWRVVVDGALISSSHERKHLAMQLALLFLAKLPSLSYTKYIVSTSFVKCLLDTTASRDNLLYKAAQQCISDICKWGESDEERSIQLILAFQTHSSGRFDYLSRTQSVRRLITGVKTISGYQSLFKALVKVYNMPADLDVGVAGKLGTGTKKRKAPVEDSDVENGSEVKKDSPPDGRRWVIEQLRTLSQQALAKLPINVAVELVINFVPSLIPGQPLEEDEKESLEKLQSTLQEVCNALPKAESADIKDRLEAMIALLVQLLYEARLTPSVAVETAAEISICCKKAFGDLVKLEVDSDAEEGSDTPDFMDVLVDFLLSLLAQPSAPVRSAAEQVFKSFSGDLTSSGLADMLRIVKKNTKAARHKPVVVVDEVKDDDEDIVDVEESDDDMDEDGDVEDEEDGSDVSESDNEDAGPDEDIVPRKGDVKASGPLGGEEKSEDEEEASDLDDEAMFKFDKHLALIVKQRKEGGTDGAEESKDAQTQLMHFKFRVLSLLEFFVQKQSDSLLVLTILPSLLHVFVNSSNTEGDAPLADRVGSLLSNKLCKSKQYPKGSQVDPSGLKDLLKKSLKLASRSTIKRVSVVAQSCALWLLKVILGNSEKEQDKEVENIYLRALEDFFESKKCKLPSIFFKECVGRHPWLGSVLLGAILEKCVSARTEYLQFEAINLAGSILGLKNAKKHLKTEAELKSKATLLKPHLGSLSATILSLMKNPPKKAARRAEVILFCSSVVELYQIVFPEKALSEFIHLEAASAAISELNNPALAKGKLSNLIVKLQQLLNSKR